jgi:hypothetical protein
MRRPVLTGAADSAAASSTSQPMTNRSRAQARDPVFPPLSPSPAFSTLSAAAAAWLRQRLPCCAANACRISLQEVHAKYIKNFQVYVLKGNLFAGTLIAYRNTSLP